MELCSGQSFGRKDGRTDAQTDGTNYYIPSEFFSAGITSSINVSKKGSILGNLRIWTLIQKSVNVEAKTRALHNGCHARLRKLVRFFIFLFGHSDLDLVTQQEMCSSETQCPLLRHLKKNSNYHLAGIEIISL